MSLKILGVSGSMREGSSSTRATVLALEAASRQGAETRLLDLRVTELPLYRPSEESPVAAVREALDAVNWADAFVLASPDYHGSMSGAMKNFLDYHWSEFAGKVFAYVCSSHEKGLTVMDQMRTAVRQCYGWSLPYGLSINGDQDFDSAGNFVSAKLLKRLEMIARDLVVYGTVIREQFLKDLAGPAPDTFAARYRE